jgi:hypothetical protein
MKTGAAATAACGPDAMIDDCEDQNNQVIVQKAAPVTGTPTWTTTTTIQPTAASRAAPSPCRPEVPTLAVRRAHVGHPRAERHRLLRHGHELPRSQEPYDASMYGGVKFFARKGPGSTEKVRLKIPDVSTDPDAGKCKECATTTSL